MAPPGEAVAATGRADCSIPISDQTERKAEMRKPIIGNDLRFEYRGLSSRMVSPRTPMDGATGIPIATHASRLESLEESPCPPGFRCL